MKVLVCILAVLAIALMLTVTFPVLLFLQPVVLFLIKAILILVLVLAALVVISAFIAAFIIAIKKEMDKK